MKYSSTVIAGAALAQLAHGAQHRDQYGRVHEHIHAKKNEIVTEVEYVTVWASGHRHASSTTSTTSPDPTHDATVEATIAAPTTSEPPVTYSTTITSASTSALATGITKSSLTPNGNKAGLSGYVGIQNQKAFTALAPYISWYSDYTAVTPDSDGVIGIGMLWGADGSPCGEVVTDREGQFKTLVADTAPTIMFGFYEPDCSCDSSSEMSVSDAATQWNNLLAPLANNSTILGSPSMCKQKDEDFLTPFNASISTTWDVTSIHVNKPDLPGVMADVEYYVSTYNKPVWVSEFACVYDQNNFTPCTNQTYINDFISQIVTYFEDNDNVVAYGPSNGDGLGTVWPLTDSQGNLSETGNAYLSAIQSLSHPGTS